MSTPGYRPVALIAAAMAIGGLVVAVWPQHGLSVMQLVTVTAAVAAGVHTVLVNVSSGTWDVRESPLGRLARRTEAPTLPSDLDRTHSQLRSTRYRYGDLALPWGTARQLRRIAAAALERRGINMDDSSHHAAARRLVSPLTWTVLTHDRNSSRGVRPITLPSHASKTARIVHLVLDDLDRLATAPAGGPQNMRPTRGS